MSPCVTRWNQKFHGGARKSPTQKNNHENSPRYGKRPVFRRPHPVPSRPWRRLRTASLRCQTLRMKRWRPRPPRRCVRDHEQRSPRCDIWVGPSWGFRCSTSVASPKCSGRAAHGSLCPISSMGRTGSRSPTVVAFVLASAAIPIDFRQCPPRPTYKGHKEPETCVRATFMWIAIPSGDALAFAKDDTCTCGHPMPPDPRSAPAPKRKRPESGSLCASARMPEFGHRRSMSSPWRLSTSPSVRAPL